MLDGDSLNAVLARYQTTARDLTGEQMTIPAWMR